MHLGPNVRDANRLLADMSVFSFHQQKNMVTLGEGGMVTTSDPVLFRRMLGLRSLCCRSYDPKGKYLAFDEAREPMGSAIGAWTSMTWVEISG